MPRLTDATKAARRAQIIEAAISCFLEKGYTNTSMSDIIKASGLSSGSIYSHFSGKEDILITAINERLNNVKELYETLPEGAGPQDILETIHTNQLVNDNFSAMLRIRLESLHAPEIARATADIMPLLQGIIVKTLTLWAAEQLSVLHEINPDSAQRTPEQEALIADYARDTADAFMMVFQGYMLRSFFGSTEEKDRLYRVAMALLPE
ncbi:MAG: TetR/AcrR family transcriptional regulator [Rothia sp.]|uniref:TetR/AcrR family transcriptional regulator n=1 Tax=Rothia sp. (in: high G+C Gram-positive bacteria) TaxID=1885016 RepID=UPI001CADC91D|nr:TetR/AcrR family transcriptional regulator [Rothia sp. (in: high G+C Gram-positive bacteria)]MBF1679738.1 TetR/AcrR family transcriptional regulator [Rothia sp. (in: high G+C Gram-positive bacteria)]